MELSTHPYLLVNRRYCPHCNKSSSFKTYKAHKWLYFNKAKKEWQTTSDVVTLGVALSEAELSNSDQESPPNSEEEGEVEDISQSSPPPSHEEMPIGEL